MLDVNVNLYLHSDLKPYFSAREPLFDQVMALRGDCFRHQDGRLTQRLQVGGKRYFIKQHSGVGWKEIFKNLFQLRWPVLGAKNEWRALEKLQSLGVSVPAVVGFGQRGANPAELQSFILMEELFPVVSLEELTRHWRQSPPAFVFKRLLIEEVARIARQLHENGINHRDFYICHFLLDMTPGCQPSQANNLKLYLIDLHRAQIRRLTPERWIIKDLAGLYFSSKDIGLTQRDGLRFMKHYHNKTLRDIGTVETEFWQKVKMRGEQLYRDHS
jgi:heptose I phosphotransferase